MRHRWFGLIRKLRDALAPMHVRLIALALLAFCLFTMLSVWIWSSKLTAQATTGAVMSLKSLIRATNNNFDVALKGINDITALISLDINNVLNSRIMNFLTRDETSVAALVRTRAEAEETLTSLAVFNSNIKGLAVYDLSGVSAEYLMAVPSRQAVEQSWFQQIVSGEEQMIVLAPYYNTIYQFYTPHLVFSIVRPIYWGRNIVGVVKVDIDSTLLYKIIDVDMANEYTLYVLDQSSERVIFPLSDALPRDAGSERALLAVPEAVKESRGSHAIVRSAGRDYIAVSQVSPITKWLIVALAPVDWLMSGFVAARNQVILLAGLLGAVFALMVAIVTYGITRNLHILSREVGSIGESNMHLNIAIRSHDEAGQLYQQIRYMLRRIRDLVAGIRAAERQKRKLEIAALQAQIKPHFIYNTLNTIRFLAKLNNQQNIYEVSESLSQILRQTFDNRTVITVADEIEYLQSYLKIQNYHYAGKFVAVFEVDPNATDAIVPKLLLQPIVENAIAHGLASKQSQGVLQIRVTRETDTLLVRIKDNGVGMTRSRIDEVLSADVGSNHIGVRNTKERLKLLYGDAAGIGISSEPGLYTQVDIWFNAEGPAEEGDSE